MFDAFSSESFMPHGHCYLWEPALVWLQVVSNGLIGLAYLAISATLVYLVKKGQYLPFKGMAIAFGLFIITCGLTHFFDIYVIWVPAYWIDGGLRAATAICSVGTALMLPPLVPRAVALARGAKAARERGVELQAVVEGLGELVEKTRALDQLKTEFFANISHELRTPLTLVLGPAEKLQRAPHLQEEDRHDLDVIVRNARSLLRHVNDLLDLSRLEAGKLEPDYARVDIVAHVRRVWDQFSGLAEERNMRTDLKTSEVLIADVDPDKFQRIVLNLLSNAFKFTGEGGIVRCRIAKTGPTFALEVYDSGPGIAKDQRDLVFERFRQIEGGATRRFGGTGLGLAIVKDFVDLHHGSVAIGDSPEGGAKFTVELPLRAPEGTHLRTAEEGSSEISREMTRQAIAELRTHIEVLIPRPSDSRPKVLVVEDNPDMNRFVRETLSQRYATAAAYNGRDGITQTLELRPDLVISDVMMPEVSGEDLVADLRSREELAHIPILLLTAKADNETKIRLLREGAQDFLTKPFSAEELLARVGNLVAMKRARDLLQGELDVQVKDLETLAAEVTHRKRELGDALEAMRVARQHAENASQLKANFLGLVSHELRAPLATLDLQIERLRIEQAGEDEARILTVTRMARSAGRLRTLIEGLLRYARAQSDHIDPFIEVIDVAELAGTLVEQLSPRAAAKHLTLEASFADALPPLSTDPQLLRLVLMALLDNALKFTEQGSVHMHVHKAPTVWVFTVRDTGPGIPETQRVRIFEPFEHVADTRNKHETGLGLGLALARNVVASLGGTLTVDSHLGAGTTFTLALPDAILPQD